MIKKENEDRVEELYERANDLQFALVEAQGLERNELMIELNEIEEELETLDITLEELEMSRRDDYV